MPYTDTISEHDVDQLLADREGPCVSIYLPTAVVTQDTAKDRIRLKNQRAEAFEQLSEWGLRRPDAEAILLPVDDVLEDEGFWPYLSDGLAIYASPDMHALYRLPLSPTPTVWVGDRFHLKPLLPLLTENAVFHIIAVSQDEVRLFEGTQHHVRPVEVKDVPTSMTAALHRRGREPGRDPHRRWQGAEGQKLQYRQFFMQVDRALRREYGRHREPLVFAGVDYLFPIFREATTYRHLVDDFIVGNPDQMTAEELHAKAWPIVEQAFARPRQEALRSYRVLEGSGRTSTDLETILNAGLDGRIETLFVSESESVFGHFDRIERTLAVRAEPERGDRDLGAQAARYAFGTGARILAGDPPEIPEGGPVAAIFRYA